MNKLFPNNEHMVERVLRVGAGLALVGFTYSGSLPVWGYLGAVPLVTGLIGSCPLYTLFGISTCRLRQNPSTSTTSN